MTKEDDFKAKFDTILDANAPDFEQQLLDALGLEPGDDVQITTPQFERTDGKIITYLPNTPEEYAALPQLSKETLLKIGCGMWDGDDNVTHWLFPEEWYNHIPNGTKIVTIMGKHEEFTHGKTDDGIRFGMLAYGFLQHHTVVKMVRTGD